MSQDEEHRFSFETMAEEAVEDRLPPAETIAVQNMERALNYAGQVSYHWDIGSDLIRWSANAPAVLMVQPDTVTTGRKFAGMMDSENFFSRYDTVLRSSQRDSGDGVPYEIEYRLKPEPDSETPGPWIEDTGRWFAGADGKPKEALGVMRIANERHSRDQHMSFLSNCDPLTGMMNRARLTEALGEAIEVAHTDKVPCAFAILAVNNLDVMNEAYGYEVADEVIVALGQRLRQVMRMGDGIARYSGSKFAIILNSCKPDELSTALERFMRAVRDSVIETRLGPVWALLSIGAVSLPALGDTAAQAIAHSEEALSEAFRLPSDGYVIFTSSEERKARRLLNARCATEIVSCLRDGLFKLAFQPVFDAHTGEVQFHEALLRMADTTGALITAGHLVPIAERLGLIRLIDRAVLQLALKTLQTYPLAKLSVNISATTVNDLRWHQQLLDMIAATPDAAARLIVEITETAALGNLATSQAFCAALQSLGCGVALDDFGAGYTSYRNLKELALSHVKLDGSFCCNLQPGGENQVFVHSMVELAKAFGLRVIAEWVDTPEDVQTLASMGVDCLQGNLLGEASITPPWGSEAEAAFTIEAPSLEPVDAGHFEHVAPAIEDPKLPLDAAAGENPARTDGVILQNMTQRNLQQVADSELEQEIEFLEQQADGIDPVTYEVPLEPVYETAMALPEQLVEADLAVFAAALENQQTEMLVEVSTVAIGVEAASPEPDDGTASVEDSLAQLRAALAELSAAMGVPEEERLAS